MVQGELAHRTVKSRYRLTNKRSDAMAQIGRNYLRHSFLHTTGRAKEETVKREELEADSEAARTPRLQFYISKSRNRHHDIYKLAQEASNDPACMVQVFLTPIRSAYAETTF